MTSKDSLSRLELKGENLTKRLCNHLKGEKGKRGSQTLTYLTSDIPSTRVKNMSKKKNNELRLAFLRDISYLYKVLGSCDKASQIPACDKMRHNISLRYKGVLQDSYTSPFLFNEYESRKSGVIECCVPKIGFK